MKRVGVSADFVIIESALNDIQCYNSTGINLKFLLEKIDETDRAFASCGIPVLSILWPIRFDVSFSQTDAAKQILEQHRKNIATEQIQNHQL